MYAVAGQDVIRIVEAVLSAKERGSMSSEVHDAVSSMKEGNPVDVVIELLGKLPKS